MKTRIVIALALALAGCKQQAPQVSGEPTVPDHWTPTTPGDRGPGSIDPLPAAGEGKLAHRLSVEQLRNSLPALFGGDTWTVQQGNNPRNQAPALVVLSRTLGEADYIQSTQNNEDPTPLFAKFMDDMAGDVCRKAVNRDQAESGEKLVIKSPGDPDENLRFLRLKLHGLYVPPGSSEGITELRRLYDEVLADTGSAGEGWYTVCVAMLSAPEMMAY